MKHRCTSFISAIIIVLIISLGHSAIAQRTQVDPGSNLFVPGPANQDTGKYATFYIIRPDNEIAKTYWLGIYFDDTLMIRMDNNIRCVIKYPGNRKMNIWSKNELTSSVLVNTEAGKEYYITLEMVAGGKIGNSKLTLLDKNEGEEVFNKMKTPPLYIYDPDPLMNSRYIWPIGYKTGYEHMNFSAPLSTRHYVVNALEGFKFTYYNRSVSPSFSEIDGVYGGKMSISDKEEFDKFANKQINNLKKGLKKSEIIKEFSSDTLTSTADYISSTYFVTEDSKPSLPPGVRISSLELRQYSVLIYKNIANNNKGDFYSIYFSERGLPDELHTKEEIRYKINALLKSCEFGDFK